jgi:hypothetical protein
MAIPSSDVGFNTHLMPQLWGDLTVTVAKSLNNLGLTINISGEHMMSDFYGLSASFSRTPTSINFAAPGTQNITVTANCAWQASYSGSAVFQLQNCSQAVILSGSPPTSVNGGSGVLQVSRNATSNPGQTGTVTLTFSNGAGGHSTLTVTLTTNY